MPKQPQIFTLHRPESKDIIMTNIGSAKPGFQLRNLSVLNYANGFTSWHYRVEAPSSLISVLPTGFFSPTTDLIAHGDLVTISAPDGIAQGAFACDKPGIIQLYLLSKVLFDKEAQP
jgi:hypothetical protein